MYLHLLQPLEDLQLHLISSLQSGVARGVLRGLEHPLSQKRKKNRIGIFQKIKL